MVFLEILAEFLGSGVVGFYRPDFADALSEGDCDDTRAGANVEHEVALFEIAMADKFERKTR